MKIEEKAQAYNEAIERATQSLECGDITRENLEYIFPELNEDKMIREDILGLIRYTKGRKIGYEPRVHQDKMIAWIEKQGEEEITCSKDDEENMNNVLYILNQLKDTSAYKEDGIVENTINWLKSIKDRLYPDNDYDKDMLEAIEYCIKNNRPLEREHFVWLKEYCEQKIADNVKLTEINPNEDEHDFIEEPNFFDDFRKTDSEIKPKFHEGDWVVWQDKCYKVNFNGCGYELIDQNGLHTSLEYGTIDENAHLWTIADAKAGDVLAFDNIIVMFKDLYKKFAFHSYGYIEYEEFCISKDNISNCWEGKGFHPATKAQRDTLFAKMEEEGYKWDAENKELKKIEQDSTWSDEDEKMLHTIIADFKGFSHNNTSTLEPHFNECIIWLKTIKKRIGWKPSEEQMKALALALHNVHEMWYKKHLLSLKQQLKQL